jgi:phosphohistidine phosphatase SixA
MKTAIAFTVAVLLSVPALAQGTIFVVRHAERADAGTGGTTMMATDPNLSDAGRARAESLAAMLRDAKITTIYTTEYNRTKQTAEPLAKALGIQPTVVQSPDMKGLIEKVKAGGNALVVGHSNTVGPILEALGVSEKITLGDSDYDNLFVVVPGEKPTLVRLHFE